MKWLLPLTQAALAKHGEAQHMVSHVLAAVLSVVIYIIVIQTTV